ncbi:MAG TPA: malto-oligosyltrehalose synthase, partial [Chitinophagaceae bacterium]
MGMLNNYPANTYRIQFNKGFPLNLFEKIIPYLRKLGVQTIYASPIFQSVPGSDHGYDGTDPLQINPEIGSIEQLKDIILRLQKEGIGWLQDIVPNHMAFHHQNRWLMDVLEKGCQSRFLAFFDMDLSNKLFEGKLITPFLGAPLQDVLERNELKLVYENERLQLSYFESFFPLNAQGYEIVLNAPEWVGGANCQELLRNLKDVSRLSDIVEYARSWEAFLSQLHKCIQIDGAGRYLNDWIKKINSDKDPLKKIIDCQYYYLCHWQEADKRINYRRFFTVNGLICLNIQDPHVFDQYHLLIKSLTKEGFFTGLRVDHIDGLYDPADYLQRLKEIADPHPFIVVEKILEPGEMLADEWQTEGTTGYDFLYLVNNLFTNKKSEAVFTSFYNELVHNYSPVEEQARGKKSLILYQFMKGELDNLYSLLISILDEKILSTTAGENLKTAIAEFLICCPVYRFYGDQLPFENKHAEEIENILTIVDRAGRAESDAIDVLRKLFLEFPSTASEEEKNRILHFYKRCMQFTGPLMAKGVEDTLMYTYNRFIVHNDVGDSPASFGITGKKFNRAMITRQIKWPLTLNATSTHDTKRGEDVRARLNVLSDLAENWFSLVRQWIKMNAVHKQGNVPDANDEYFIYQNIVGAYPMPGCDDEHFVGRIEAYLIKALHEAKTNSGWVQPNVEYERATIDFIRKLLDRNSAFFKDFTDFYQHIVDFGIINSLVQVLLKFTCPGIPDLYQGCEFWDLSFVDPDNRRPIDFILHSQLLDEINAISYKGELFTSLWKDRYNGQVKMWLTKTLLTLRRHDPVFFKEAVYVPLTIKGEFLEFVFAFARNLDQKWLIVIAALHSAELCRQQNVQDIFQVDWRDTKIILPPGVNHLRGKILHENDVKTNGIISVGQIFKTIPFMIFEANSDGNIDGNETLPQ